MNGNELKQIKIFSQTLKIVPLNKTWQILMWMSKSSVLKKFKQRGDLFNNLPFKKIDLRVAAQINCELNILLGQSNNFFKNTFENICHKQYKFVDLSEINFYSSFFLKRKRILKSILNEINKKMMELYAYKNLYYEIRNESFKILNKKRISYMIVEENECDKSI